MTTVSIRPVREAHGWGFSDSSVFNDYLRNVRVISSNTLPSPGMTTVYGAIEFEGRFNPEQELRRRMWAIPTIQAIANLPWKTDTWTSGGSRTQRAAVINMLGVLVEVLDDSTPPPSVVPTRSGGVQVEWHQNGVDFEIEANPRRGVEYYFRSPAEEHEGRAWEDLSQLVKYAQAVTVSE